MANKRVWMKPWVCYPVVIAAIVIVVIAWWFCWYSPVTTALIVRHAELSAAPPTDPPLSAAGQARAQTLIHLAGDAGITAVFATEFTRTQQTVQPLATHLGLSTIQINAANVEELVGQVLSDHAGKVVFIAGHSNTVPLIIEELGGVTMPPLAENEFDNLFIVIVYRFGGAKVVHLHYGNPS